MTTDIPNINFPKITVFTSHYNVKPEYLRRAVESILNQTFKDFEYIISDNGSSDGTAAILDEYAEKDGRIKVIHREENNSGKSLEDVIMNIARGNYLVFLDNDDYYEPDFLEEMYKLQTNTRADLVACGTEISYENSSKKDYRSYHDIYVDDYSKLKNIFFDTVWVAFATAWCKLFKLDIVREVVNSGIFSEYHKCYVDTMFCLAYALHSNSLSISSKILHHYFVRHKSQICSWNRIQIDWANGTFILFKRCLKKWDMYTQKNKSLILQVYMENISRISMEMNQIKPDEGADAFAGLFDILSTHNFFELYSAMDKKLQETYFNTVLSLVIRFIPIVEEDKESERLKDMFLYQICKPLESLSRGNRVLSAEDLEAYLKGLYADENICRFGKQWLWQIIKEYNDKMFELFNQCDIDFVAENPSFLYALFRGVKQYPLVEGLKLNRLIQKCADIVTLLLNKDYTSAFGQLLKTCDSNAKQQENIVLLEMACTTSALQNDTVGFLLACKRKAEFLIQQKNYEGAAKIVLDLEEMLPKDQDVLTYKIDLLVKTGRLDAARVLTTDISSYSGFPESFKRKINNMIE